MLKIIKSGFTAGGREALYESIKRLVTAQKKVYLIVPEQQTVMAESETTDYLPDYAPKFFEATNFTRLANSTFRALGGISGEYCDKAKKALIMWRTLTELSPILTMTKSKKEISSALVETAMSAVSDMQVLGIGIDDISDCASRGCTDQRLNGKLSDLAAIYALYKKQINEKYADTADDIDALADKLRENPDYLCDTEFFIEGFTSFTSPQRKLLSVLMARTSVTVHLTIPKAQADGFEYTELRDTEQTLKGLARRCGTELFVKNEDGLRNIKSELLSEISGRLFRNYPHFDKISLQNSEDLRIIEAQTPFDMCEVLAADIKRRVVMGDRYRDFAIVARRAESYDGIIDRAFERAGIPAFYSKKNDISSYEAIKLIYTAYSVIKSGFSRQNLLSYAKCSLSGISREECDEFESYVEKWQLNGKRFTDPEPWSMNPKGYTIDRPEGTDEKLVRIHRTRMSLVTPLLQFEAETAEAKTVKDHANALLNLLLTLEIESALKAKSAKLLSFGEAEHAEANSRLWKIICDALDTVVEVSGDSETNADGFLGQLKVLFSFVDISRIPAHVDEVTVGSADMLRLHGKKHVYLIGVNTGEFPMAATDTAFFSERDKIMLSEMGLDIKPELQTRSAKELYFFSRAFSYAEQSVTLLYSACDTKFKAITRSEVIDKIINLTSPSIEIIKSRNMSADRLLWSPIGASAKLSELSELQKDALKKALLATGHDREVQMSESDITNADLSLGREICEKNSEKTLSLTQSRLDSFKNCPLSYFCRYTLKLSGEERAEFDAASIGSFIHSILENFFRTLKQQNREAASLTQEERRALTEQSAQKYLSQLGESVTGGSAGTRVKLNRLCRAAMPVIDDLCDEFAHSKFKPTFFELSLFGDGENSPGTIRLSDPEAGDMKIYGIVDRVDTYQKDNDVYVRVVDYKTGKKEFSVDDMSEGRNLQMFLYLDAIINTKNKGFKELAGVKEDGKLLPAGVTYQKTAIGDTKINLPDEDLAKSALKAAQIREGMILNDDDVISASGLRYTPLYSQSSPDKISAAKQKFLFDPEGFEQIMETVREQTVNIARGIRSGNACAIPAEGKHGATHCDFCEFKPICRKAEIK